MVARDCLEFGKNLLTASYIDPEIRKLEKEIEQAGLLFMYEMGLDPGIDHMSAMKLIQSIEKKGGQISCFRSYCGGLISPKATTTPGNTRSPGTPATLCWQVLPAPYTAKRAR